MRIIVAGASGRMGREVVRMVAHEPTWKLVAAVSPTHAGQPLRSVLDSGPSSLFFTKSVEEALQSAKGDVLIDFTNPDVVQQNMEKAIVAKVSPVVGTTGLNEQAVASLQELCSLHQTGCVVAPNFSIGAVLMMAFASQVARFFSQDVEIIESHHDRKRDAPSGTALWTADLIAANRSKDVASSKKEPSRPLVRGAMYEKVPLHSVRLPGLLAHQKCIFARPGELLTLKHDCTDRKAFMLGVKLAAEKVVHLQHLVYGLESLLDPIQ